MAQTIPPSPAPSNDENLASGFNHLVHHNTATSYPRDQLSMDPSSLHIKPQPTSRLGTPAAQMPMAPGYDGLPQYQQGAYQFQGYQQPMYASEQSQYGPLPDELHPSASQPYSTPVASPPTPSQRSDNINLRSGAARRSQDPKPLAAKTDRVQKPAAKKKKERVKAPSKVAKLEKPLSELTKDWETVPVVDIEAYVNRSAEERRREVQSGKTPGRVKRPMNAFMLYRKAYQTRTKDWCLHNNHQVVSQVCGQSWPLEPDEIREQFNEWARTERLNHQKAHPDYKFTPAKPKAAKRKLSSDHEGDASGAEDFDWEKGRPISRNRSRTRTQTPMSEPGGDYPPAHTAYAYPYAAPPPMARGMPPMHSHNRSAFHYSNPGKPMPPPYDYRLGDHGHYYQQHIQPAHAHLQVRGPVEDVMIHKTPSPAAAYHHTQQPDMLAHYAPPPPQLVDHGQPLAYEQQQQQQQHHVDPLLFPQGNFMDPSMGPWLTENGLDGTQGWGDLGGQPGGQPAQHPGQGGPHFGSVGFANLDQTLLQDPLLKGTTESWHISTLEGEQLENWVDQTTKNEI